MTDQAQVVTEQAITDFVQTARALEGAINRTVVGQPEVVRQTLIAILSGGHVLLEGVPGLGKTLLVRTIGRALNLTFSRIQFTPDLMPADATGTLLITEDDRGRRVFRFQPGPLFANVVLADEINRATPKTQSALLEAMQEGTVTVGETTHPLPHPFLVLATQNPLEMEGTYPLPEAQLDRFFVKIIVPFPSEDVLRQIVTQTLAAPENISTVADGTALLQMQQVARAVPVASPIIDQAVRIIAFTHPGHPQAPDVVRRYVRAGASPRGLQALVTGAQVRALLEGRYNVASEDLQALAQPVLRHRLLLTFDAHADGILTDAIIAATLGAVLSR